MTAHPIHVPTPRTCTIENCGKPHYGRGWCSAHYQRWLHHRDPLAGAPSPAPIGEPLRYYREVVLTYEGDECLPWPFGKTHKGYGRLLVDGHPWIVSRLVCEHVNGPQPTPDHRAAHSCGKGHLACCTKSHLSWKTWAENEADKIVHGTSSRGERNGGSRLTETEVRSIGALKGIKPGREIAVQFGITHRHVLQIHRGLRWGWLFEEVA